VSKVDPDQELICRVAAGDPAAVRAMAARKLPRLLGVATRMLGDRAEAEDVAQEAFVKLWRQARRWRPGAAMVDTWLHRVTLNLCYDRLRRRREIPAAAPPEQTDPAPGADMAMIRAARDAALAADIRRHALEGHHRHGAGIFRDFGLLGGGDVHDHAAFELLGQTDLDGKIRNDLFHGSSARRRRSRGSRTRSRLLHNPVLLGTNNPASR